MTNSKVIQGVIAGKRLSYIFPPVEYSNNWDESVYSPATASLLVDDGEVYGIFPEISVH